jgi:succinoglycan biosynthesis protein ExoO
MMRSLNVPIVASIIIAAYDAEAFVADAVRSALQQTLRNIEVLVVDDGSRDDTARAVLAAADGDPRLRLLVQPVNAGVAVARNVALHEARGRWVAVLDADDTFLPDRLERLIETAEALNADLLADEITLIFPGTETSKAFAIPARYMGRPMSARSFIALDTPGLETLPAGFVHPIMRRSFLVRFKLQYPPDISCGEDFDLYVRCLLRGGRLFFVAESYYCALVRANSLSRADPERNNEALMRSMARLIAEARRLGDLGAARMLMRRANDMSAYDEYSRLSDALHRRRLVEACRVFLRLFTCSYTWRRFGMAARRRFMRGHAA